MFCLKPTSNGARDGIPAVSMKVAEEVADTILYGLLLMASVGITDPDHVIAEIFNRKSIEYGFPERM